MKNILKTASLGTLILALSMWGFSAARAAPNTNATTNPATMITSSSATLNGTNGSSSAVGHSFWVSLSPFSTASSTIPSGVYSTPDMGAIAANTSFSASLSSLTTSGVPTNLPAILPNTTYYFVAWSNVGGTWYPGEMLNFTTASTNSGGGQVGNETEDSNESATASENENEVNDSNSQVQSSDNQENDVKSQIVTTSSSGESHHSFGDRGNGNRDRQENDN